MNPYGPNEEPGLHLVAEPVTEPVARTANTASRSR
ncbi:hypothetical protein GA0115245_111744 [Streptomyces sp. di188]|nr:hypothetical protein GA0115238_119240 [Streptomyces sp. di50b]SCD69862.1 hypothetical protein GA0115245_111744 [Streptomyces sp. di188]